MQEVYDVSWVSKEATAVALGYFDGVHVAHRYLIKQMMDYANKYNLKKSVFTFTKTIKLGHKGKDLITKSEKLNQMIGLGVELFYCPDFYDFSSLTPQEFVQNILIKSMNAKAVFCGENFFFGKNRSGDVAVLKKLCLENDIKFFQAETVMMDNQIVSSTAIRNALSNGEMEKVCKMLGRPYSVDFEVTHGKKIGRTIGTPTINQIYPDTMCTPKEGVYLSSAFVNGVRYPSATGFGTRPTVNGIGYTSETYILGFDGDLYHQNIKVEFYKYLFAPKKFDNLNQLGEMIIESALASKDFLTKQNLV